MSRLYDGVANVLRHAYDARIDAPAILNLETDFPDGRNFIEQWKIIRDEARTVAEHVDAVPRFHEVMAEQESISANDGRDWRIFILKAYGVEFPDRMAKCPALRRLVLSSPDVVSASFSLMAPYKRIPAHRGPFRGILRFTMPLMMPRGDDGRPAAVLKIGRDELRLAEGEAVLWDDTCIHETWNESNEWRIVLLLDVRRHGLPADLRLLSQSVVFLAGTYIRWHGYAASLEAQRRKAGAVFRRFWKLRLQNQR